MDKVVAIIPTSELVTKLTEIIGEVNVPEVDYMQLAKVILVGSLSFNDTNWGKLQEATYGALNVLGREIEYMSINGNSLSDVPELHNGIVALSQRLYRILINLEVDIYNTDPTCDLPYMTLMDISKHGDMIVEIYQTGEGL